MGFSVEIIQYILMALVILFLVRKFIPTKGVRQITTAQLKTELKSKDKQFVDVRTPMEFKGNHIKQFKNIPLNALKAEAKNLSKEKEVIVICQSGMRSNAAVKQLKKLGFSNVTNVKGGMNAW